jgi:hypothetical protein
MEMHQAMALLKRAEKLLRDHSDPDKAPLEMECFVSLQIDIEEALFAAGWDVEADPEQREGE